ELLQQRTQQAEAAARAAHQANAERERVKEQAAVEIQARASDLARAGSELGALRRRTSELEAERAAREASVNRLLADAEAQRRTIAEEALDAERRHGSETQRLKTSLVELERRLEGSSRSEAQVRRRVAELEKERAERIAQQAQLAAAEEALGRAREELEDLKSENDFLNGEVARYHQKNKDLLTQAKKA
ncbi:MAG TPA: response regulator, partial [Anaeromyxobacteraceae bacterium]